jgi:hypothetical protein
MPAISVWEALRDAAAAARGDGKVHMDAPATAENVLNALKRQFHSLGPNREFRDEMNRVVPWAAFLDWFPGSRPKVRRVARRSRWRPCCASLH